MGEATESKDISWVVSRTAHLRWAETELDFTLGLKTEHMGFADKALEALLSKKYPLIVMDEVLAAGDLQLPEGLGPSMYREIAAYVIKKVREDSPNKDTPIVVMHVGMDTRPVDLFLKAGATECYDWSKQKSGEEFSDVVIKYT